MPNFKGVGFVFFVTLLLSCLVGLFLYLRNENRIDMGQFWGSGEKVDLRKWDPVKDFGNYSKIFLDGPRLIGLAKDGRKEVLGYQGTVKKFGARTLKLTLENEGKSVSIKLDNNTMVEVISGEGSVENLPKVDNGSLGDIREGREVKVYAGNKNNLVVVVVL